MNDIHIPTWDEVLQRKVKEKNFAIRRDQHDFRFRKKWFRNRNQVTFSTFLTNRFRRGRPYRILTVGVFEAAAEVWLLQHVATHRDSRIISIDPWASTTKLGQDFMEEAYRNALHNVSPWGDKIRLIRGTSQEVLAEAIRTHRLFGVRVGSFDLVYLDGDHSLEPVRQDAEHALKLVHPGGWIVFDDVRQDKGRAFNWGVKGGIDAWLEAHPDEIEHLWSHRYCEGFRREK